MEVYKLSDLKALPAFRFKGERTYVQGPDLFDAVALALESMGDGYVQGLTFRSFTNKQCQIFVGNFERCRGKVICEGQWRSNCTGELKKYRVCEANEPVSIRQPFEEEKMVEGGKIVEDGISGPYASQFTIIENVVALTKKFHNEKFPLSEGKWVFGQIVLNERLPDSCGLIQIENHQNIKDRFSRNRIVLDGHLVGEIRFIVA